MGKYNDNYKKLTPESQIRSIENRDATHSFREENIYRLIKLDTYAVEFKEIKESLGSHETLGDILKNSSAARPNSRRNNAPPTTISYTTLESRLPRAKRDKILGQTQGNTLTIA
jgi:hypothetical protein